MMGHRNTVASATRRPAVGSGPKSDAPRRMSRNDAPHSAASRIVHRSRWRRAGWWGCSCSGFHGRSGSGKEVHSPVSAKPSCDRGRPRRRSRLPLASQHAVAGHHHAQRVAAHRRAHGPHGAGLPSWRPSAPWLVVWPRPICSSARHTDCWNAVPPDRSSGRSKCWRSPARYCCSWCAASCSTG